MSDPAAGSFHLDKRVPVALLVTLLVQTGAIVWWAAGVSAAQDQAGRDQAKLEVRVERIESFRDDLSVRVIRIEEQLKGQDRKLDQQDSKLDTILRSVRGRPGEN